jgi:hypothetical protein
LNVTGPTYTYIATYESAGSYWIEVIVEDNGIPPLSVSHKWLLTVIDAIPLPVIFSTQPEQNQVVHVGETIIFSVSAYDPAGRILNFKWYLDGRIVAQNEKFYAFQATVPGTYKLKVEVIAGDSKVHYVWEVTVLARKNGKEGLQYQPPSEVVKNLVLWVGGLLVLALVFILIFQTIRNRRKACVKRFLLQKPSYTQPMMAPTPYSPEPSELLERAQQYAHYDQYLQTYYGVYQYPYRVSEEVICKVCRVRISKVYADYYRICPQCGWTLYA